MKQLPQQLDLLAYMMQNKSNRLARKQCVEEMETLEDKIGTYAEQYVKAMENDRRLLLPCPPKDDNIPVARVFNQRLNQLGLRGKGPFLLRKEVVGSLRDRRLLLPCPPKDDNIPVARVFNQRLCPVVSGYVRLEPVISGCFRLSPVMSGYVRLSPVVSGYLRLYPVRTGYLRLFPVVSGYVRLEPVMSGYLRLFPVISERLFPVISGCFRLSPVMSGYLRLAEVDNEKLYSKLHIVDNELLNSNVSFAENVTEVCKRLGEVDIHFGKGNGNLIDMEKLVSGTDMKCIPVVKSLLDGKLKLRKFLEKLEVMDFVKIVKKANGEKRKNVRKYKTLDYDSQLLKHLLSHVSLNGDRGKGRYFLEVIDSLWVEYISDKIKSFGYVDGKYKPLKSSIKKIFQGVRWLTSSMDNQNHFPKDWYYNCQKVHAVFGDRAPDAIPKVVYFY
ncbi:histidine kinase-like ATPase, C-terminal domain-containing protein [Artemisia annua]|uniref:Histidine kinase-like ATPase, C-terminal domain-containing protein n=1 Tax=Artemisia annua TaxID=35608 RepID=A0A2U1MFJ6_ARTAN|nr:histidine kinase-like ATPase, C-terminal domain-containing protein [Artemisia annua]